MRRSRKQDLGVERSSPSCRTKNGKPGVQRFDPAKPDHVFCAGKLGIRLLTQPLMRAVIASVRSALRRYPTLGYPCA